MRLFAAVAGCCFSGGFGLLLVVLVVVVVAVSGIVVVGGGVDCVLSSRLPRDAAAESRRPTRVVAPPCSPNNLAQRACQDLVRLPFSFFLGGGGGNGVRVLTG